MEMCTITRKSTSKLADLADLMCQICRPQKADFPEVDADLADLADLLNKPEGVCNKKHTPIYI